jgi:hypothetical protein
LIYAQVGFEGFKESQLGEKNDPWKTDFLSKKPKVMYC